MNQCKKIKFSASRYHLIAKIHAIGRHHHPIDFSQKKSHLHVLFLRASWFLSLFINSRPRLLHRYHLSSEIKMHQQIHFLE